MIRIQRRRERGWRMPVVGRYVGRPTTWGNPWRIGATLIPDPVDPDVHHRLDVPLTRNEAVALFLRYAQARARREPRWLDPLRECTALACDCPVSVPCHADVLIELLEAPP